MDVYKLWLVRSPGRNLANKVRIIAEIPRLNKCLGSGARSWNQRHLPIERWQMKLSRWLVHSRVEPHCGAQGSASSPKAAIFYLWWDVRLVPVAHIVPELCRQVSPSNFLRLILPC